MLRNLVRIVVLLLATIYSVDAYVPALPTNDTSMLNDRMNATRASKLYLQWYNGSLWNDVSYQLAGANSTGITQGALVHFSESYINNMTSPTMTPWIALVSCDYNATNASDIEDIFTLARDKGAVSALLFTAYSHTCVINPEYADPEAFDQVLDIFSTPSLTSSQIISYQFGQYGVANSSIYAHYDSQMLNQSFNTINESLSRGTPVAPGYLVATLQAFNATPTRGPMDGTPYTQVASNNDSGNTGLAMIILYAITGCVSALFCIVIISGAVRAIRHPERYGPRIAVHQGGIIASQGQSRARGLTRAILDTFPIVKFGTSGDVNNGSEAAHKDVESNRTSNDVAIGIELPAWEVIDHPGAERTGNREEHPSSPSQTEETPDRCELRASNCVAPSSGNTTFESPEATLASNRGEGPSKPRKPATAEKTDITLDAIGRETCPICIVDFEEGDDLRLLPCEGKHRFHQDCVDPWLLELSSSCPICRQDFHALENMLWGEFNAPGGWHSESERESRRISESAPGSAGNRFSRYLRSARRRNQNSNASLSTPPTT